MTIRNDALPTIAEPKISSVILLIQAAAALLIAFALVYMLTPFGAAVSPDSIGYLDIAAHIQDGSGAKSTDYSLLAVGGNAALPNASWPPLYPALLAIASSGAPSATSAAALSAFLLALTLFFSQLILCRFLSWRLALLAGLPLALTVPMLTVHTYVWSEQLFIALLTVLFWVAQSYLLAEKRKLGLRKGLIGAVAALIVLAFYTRYIGIIFLSVWPALYLIDKQRGEMQRIYMIGAIGSLAAIAILMKYNFDVSGSITGAVRGASTSSLAAQLESLLSALTPYFFNDRRGALPLVIAIVGAVVLFYGLLKAGLLPRRREILVTAGIGLAAAAYYLICILILRSIVAFDEIDVRLLGITAPFLWIGCVALVAGFDGSPAKYVSSFLAALVVLSMAVNGYFTLLGARNSLYRTGSPELMVNRFAVFSNYNLPPFANNFRALLRDRISADSVLLSRRPDILRYTTGAVCASLPKDFSAVELRKLAELPSQSYMLVTESEANAALQVFAQNDVVQPQVERAGNMLLIHLPIVFKVKER